MSIYASLIKIHGLYFIFIMQPLQTVLAEIPSVSLYSSFVENYVREFVETQQPFEEDGPHDAFIQDVMKLLFQSNITPPVSAIELARTLQAFPAGTLATEFGQEHDFLPRLLKTLNGPSFQLVPPSILAAAADRERIVSTTDHGWGVSEPPIPAIAYRLLASCGLPPDLLPPYKTLPVTTRCAFMQTWTSHCRTFGWAPCHPDCDIRAEKRVISRQLKKMHA